jgi:hypothetical protein
LQSLWRKDRQLPVGCYKRENGNLAVLVIG